MTTSTSATSARVMANKVPQVIVVFWVIKILGTTVGETAADYLNEHLGLGLTWTTVIVAAVLTGFLVLQFRAHRYVPWTYWTVVVLISIVGTLITDNLTDHWNVSLVVSTAVFAVLLTVVFLVWYRFEGTLSIHTITTTQREAFYWLTILFTFALGTAAGDLVSERANLGYWEAGLIFAGLIAGVALAHFRFGLGEVPAFWAAYILTRPFGASLGDYLTQTKPDGGLGLSANGVSLVFLVLIMIAVGYLTRRENQRLASLSA